MEEVRHPQSQITSFLQSSGLSYPNRGTILLYQALIFCEMVDPYTSRSAQVRFSAGIKIYDRKTSSEVMRSI